MTKRQPPKRPKRRKPKPPAVKEVDPIIERRGIGLLGEEEPRPTAAELKEEEEEPRLYDDPL